MELRQLRAFAEVVRTGTFRAAASSLHLTQPALWQQVRDLQDELAVPLFERIGRGVRVTPAGAQLLERADVVLGAAARLRELAATIRAGEEGVIKIVTPAPPVQYVLAAVIGEFARAFPAVRIELRDLEPGQRPDEALASGDVDFAVGPRSAEFAGLWLCRVDVRVVVAADHAWARRQRIHVRNLRDQPLLLAPIGSLSRGLLETACARQGFAPTVRLSSGSPAMLVALARNGYGIAAAASDALAGLTPDSLPRLVDDDRSLEAEAWLQWRPGSDLSPAARHFVDRVRASVGTRTHMRRTTRTVS